MVETSIGIELYYEDHQKRDEVIYGGTIDEHLDKTGLINRCLGLDDEVVKGWISNPSTYPEEYREYLICLLWKSRGVRGGLIKIPGLVWRGDDLVVEWRWTGMQYGTATPILLRSS